MTQRSPLITRIERRPYARTLYDGSQSQPLTLKGKDAFFYGAGRGPEYDWPNPVRRAYPVDLRFWSNNLLQTTLLPAQAGTPYLFLVSDAGGVPPRRTAFRPDAFPNLLESTLRITAVPFAQTDWPNPRGRSAPIELRTFVNAVETQLIGQDLFFGPPGMGPDYDYPNPRGRSYPVDLRHFAPSALQILTAPTGAAPFSQLDWPVPKGRTPPVELRTFLNSIEIQLIGQDQFFGAAGQPPANLDWPNPRGYSYSVALRSFAVDLQQTTLAPTPPAPFNQDEWLNPRGAPFPLALRQWDNNLLEGALGLLPAPFAQSDWPLPRRPARSQDWNRGSPLELLTLPQPKPFGLSDWPVPRGYTCAITLKDGSVSASIALLTAPPIPVASSGQTTTVSGEISITVRGPDSTTVYG